MARWRTSKASAESITMLTSEVTKTDDQASAENPSHAQFRVTPARKPAPSPEALQFSPQGIVDQLVAAVLPLIDEPGNDKRPGKTDLDVIQALSPLIGHITVETAVFLYGLIDMAETVLDQGKGLQADRRLDALTVVKWILEDFASYARASSPACAAARVSLALIKSADEHFTEDHNDEGIRRSLKWDIQDMRSNDFCGETFTEAYPAEPRWLQSKQRCHKEWSPRV